MRPVVIVIALPLLALSPSVFANPAVWFDPDLGCGRNEVFVRSARVADLPGCVGVLPANAPEIERLLGAAKRALIDADTRLGHDAVDGVDALLDTAERILDWNSPARPRDAELADRWSTAVPLFHRSIASLRSRRKMSPRLALIRSSWRASTDAAATMTARERDGGPGTSLRLATACITALTDARSDGIDLATEVELEKNHLRRLDAALADCEAARETAAPLAHAEEVAVKAHRDEWRHALKGDRLKVFDDHPGALPECGATQAGPVASARSATWRYTSANGCEVFSFSGNRLKSRTTQPR